MLLHPAYRLTVGEKIVDTTDEPQASTAVSITITLDMDAPADSFALLLGQVGGFQPQRGDDARLELGFTGGTLTQVMAGKVIDVEASLTVRRVTGHSAAAALLTSYANQTYESKTAGEIVQDLAAAAGVDVAGAQDGIRLPAYVVDGRRSFYHHMRTLAQLCGFDLYINAEGELVFEKFYSGKTRHVLDYGRHIITLDIDERPARATQVDAWGESPTSSAGDAAWGWLTKDFAASKGTAGGGDSSFLLERSVLRTADAAQTAAQAQLTHFRRRAVRGSLLTTGQPQVKLGDAIRLRGVPETRYNATFQVRSVTHRITKADGFTTRIEFHSLE